MSVVSQPLALVRGPLLLARDYAELTKLRVTTLVIMTASETGLNSMYFLKAPVEFKRIMMDAKRKLSDAGADGMSFSRP